MSAQLSNKGYFAVKKETTKGTAVTPDFYIPLYEEDFTTDTAIDEDNPIIGNKLARYQSLLGLRKHSGSAKLLAEPNTAGHLLNMILTKGVTSGAGPYTHPFTLSNTTDPQAYTVDIQKGLFVARYTGVEISELGISFDKNKMVFEPKFSALKSFIVREVEEVAGTGPYTITLKTNYDPRPTDGLVVGDTLTFYIVADGSTINATVATIPNGTTLTCVADVSTLVDGDLVYIRAATPSYNLKSPFMWSLTEFRFASSAAEALTATHTPLEDGSAWTLKHSFEKEEGAQRSGSFDPAALVRTTGDVELKIKKALEASPEDLNRYLANLQQACVIRHFSEDQAYELRITLNALKFKENPVKLSSGEIVYAEGTLVPDYNTSDGQGFDVKVLNNLATI